MSSRFRLLVLIFAFSAALYSCVGSRFHVPDPQQFKTPIERFRNNEDLTLLSADKKEFSLYYLTKQKVDSLLELKKQLVFVLQEPSCDVGNYKQIKEVEDFFQKQEFECIYVSMNYEIIPNIIFNIPYNTTLYGRKIYIASNEDFGTGRWQKPVNLASYILKRNVDKKEVSSLFYILVNDSATTNKAESGRIIKP